MTRSARLSAALVAVAVALAASAASAREWRSHGRDAGAGGGATAAADALSITSTSPLPDAIAGVDYSFQFSASGGSGSYRWSAEINAPCPPAGCPSLLPPGFALSETGVLQGNPALSGDFTFPVTVVDSRGASTEAEFALHVRPSADYALSTWVPVASHVSGFNGALWQTDVAVLNPGPAATDIEIDFHGAGGVASETASMQAGAQLLLADVVGRLGASGSGALEVRSDRPVKVASRTYDRIASDAPCTPDGTQGQDYPALALADGLAFQEWGWNDTANLPGLVENARFRCNIGVLNTGTEPATVLVQLFDGSGDKLTEYTVDVAGGQWSQATQPFRTKAGQTAMDGGYAVIGVQAGFGVFAFASVIDNATNDPTTVAMGVPPLVGGLFASVPMWVPASHAPGLNGAEWRTDVVVLNPWSASANIEVDFHAAGGVVSTTASVATGAQLVFSDIVGQLGASGSAALEVRSDQPVQVTSRTYNLLSSGASCFPGGTQGQDYPAVAAGDGLAGGQSAYLAGLSENASYRCNVGLMNTGTDPATALVELFDGSGNKLTEYAVSLNAGQWAQETQPFLKKAGRAAMDSGYAKVTAQSGLGVYAFASVIDDVTNDPTTVTMQR